MSSELTSQEIENIMRSHTEWDYDEEYEELKETIPEVIFTDKRHRPKALLISHETMKAITAEVNNTEWFIEENGKSRLLNPQEIREKIFKILQKYTF